MSFGIKWSSTVISKRQCMDQANAHIDLSQYRVPSVPPSGGSELLVLCCLSSYFIVLQSLLMPCIHQNMYF